MGTHTESVKEFIKELRQKQTGYVLFTEDPNDDADVPLEFSRTKPKPGKGQVVGAVQIDGERIYVVGKKFNDNRMKAIRKAVKEAVGQKFWLMTQAEAVAAGYVLDPTLASVDDEDFDDLPPLPQIPATSSTHFDDVIPASLPPTPGGTGPQATPAPASEYGVVTHLNDDNDDDVDDKDAAAGAGQGGLGPKAAAYGKMLAAWPALFNRLCNSPVAPPAVHNDMRALDRVLRPGNSPDCYTTDDLLQLHGDGASAALDGALGMFLKLAKWSNDNPLMPGEDVADLRRALARIAAILPKWPALYDRLAATDPDNTTRAEMDRLDGLLRRGGQLLTAADIDVIHGPDAVRVIGIAEAMFVRLAKMAKAAAGLSGSGSSTGSSDYGSTAAVSEAQPAPAAASSSSDYAKIDDALFKLPAGFPSLQALRDEWQDFKDNYLAKLIKAGAIKMEAIHPIRQEINGLLEAGDPESMIKADKRLAYFRDRKAAMLKALDTLKEPAPRR